MSEAPAPREARTRARAAARGATALLIAGLGGLLARRLAAADAAPAYRIIVNAANKESSITTEQLSNLFLKASRKWSNGTAVAPVDQSMLSPARFAFSRDVFGQPVLAIQAYWQQEVAAGREGPPPVKASDNEVIEYVEANPGAIGYVSGGATIPPK